MTAIDGNLVDLERQRLELEENIHKLQQSLYHWRLWEAEYDGLKEEIATLKDDSTKQDMLEAGRYFEGTVVDEKELKAIVGEGQGLTRSRDQVVQLISRRVDYVKQNVASMEKRLAAAEGKLDALLSVERPAIGTANDDFPMTEIFEELDEDGKVISSSTSTPGDRAPELLEVLKKAGVTDIPNQTTTNEMKMERSEVEKPPSEESQPPHLQNSAGRAQHSEKIESTINGVSQVMDSNSLPDDGDDDDDDETEPVTEVDESPEEAKLRREMLQYRFHEVGAVVAELEMDEEGSEFSVEDDYDSEGDEQEDEYGRTTRRVLSEEYHQQMNELEKKMNARGMMNIGRNTSGLPGDVRLELEQPVMDKVQKENTDNVEQPEEKKKKKKVAFAAELDIAPDSNAIAQTTDWIARRKKPEVTPVSESIVERTVKEDIPAKETSTAPKRVSQFRSARNTVAEAPSDSGSFASTAQHGVSQKRGPEPSPTTVTLFPAKPKEQKPFSQPIIDSSSATSTLEPQPPEGKTLAGILVERPMSDRILVSAPDPGKIDETIHRKEIATEFYRMRNQLIQRNGGFLDDDEQPIVLLDRAADGQPQKRISKFKAARMR